MKIACLIHSLDGGGAERVMAELASRLADRGHDVTLVTLDDGTRDRHSVNSRVKRLPLDVLSTTDRPVAFFKRVGVLRRTFRKSDFEVVLSFCDTNNWLILLATLGMNLPVVISERSDPKFQSLGRAKEWLRRRLYGRAAKVIALSDDVAETLRQQTGCHAIVIPSAIDAPDKKHVGFRQPPSGDGVPQSIVAVGRLEHEKGFDRLLSALAVLPDSTPPWRLTIHGEGSQRSTLEQLADELGLSDRVAFAGWTRPIWPAYSNSDWFVLPSRYEGFPSALLEAMACGRAVLAVDAGGGVRAVIDHGCNGWMVDNSDESLRKGLAICLASPSLRNRLASNSSRIVERFGWPAMVDAYEQCLIDSRD